MTADLRASPRFALSLWLLAFALPLAGARWLCPDGQCRVPPIDGDLLAALSAMRSPLWDELAAGWTWLGSIVLLGPLLALVALMLARRGRRDEAVFVVGAMAGAVALCQGFKYWIQRPRPGLHELVGALPGDPSFPSAHTMQAAAGLLILALVAPTRWRRPALLLMLVAVLGVALTRLYLQVHFPSDVVVGLLAGWLWVLGCRALLLPAQPSATP
ncbi:MAG: phosphatase PAP2 family protein [Rhodocyclaceae bacterium]|nr:phosphatase PAP2 family protein [Rhodocyclaceae bacterium]